MRGALVVVVAAAAVWLAAPGVAQAGPCGLPDASPWWIDFADGTSPAALRSELAKPGVIVATSGGPIPAAFRRGGAQTVYWEMHLENSVGTPGAPEPPDMVVPRADALFDRAATSSGCATPVIALNELQGVTATSPLSATTTQYRVNMIAFLQELVNRGATPFLLLPSSPNMTEQAWWQQLAGLAYLVREVYQPAPKIVNQGAGGGSRAIRVALRTAVQKLVDGGIPASRVGLMLGFQSGGTVGRVGLQPLASWLDYVKLSTLAARQVAAELAIGNVWAWGWGTLSAAGADPDKATAACVSLGTRDPALCNAPSLAQFDPSLTDGQLSALPAAAQCVIDGRVLWASQLDQAQELLGDQGKAYTALLGRLAATALVPVTKADELQAERRLFPKLGRFLAATRLSGVTPGFARGVIVDELRFAKLSPAALIAEEKRQLATAVCRDDVLPATGNVRLASKLPFLGSAG
jgi:hypothetical protein